MRQVSCKHFAFAGVIALTAAVAPALAEYRAPHPEPVESLIYGSSGAKASVDANSRDARRDDAVAPKPQRETPAAKPASAKPGPKATDRKATAPKARASAASDTSRPIGTPGSPTTKGVKGTGVKKK